MSPEQILSTPLRPFGFWDFRKKKHIKSLVFAQEYLRSCWAYGPGRSVKKRSKSSNLHSKKKILPRRVGFFMSDVTSGGLLGHFGPICLALGANRYVVVFR